MIQPRQPGIVIQDGDRQLHLLPGARLVFDSYHWVEPRQMFWLAACISSEYDAQEVACLDLLPGIDLFARLHKDAQGRFDDIWKKVTEHLDEMLHVDSASHRAMEFMVGINGSVGLYRHGMVNFTDAVIVLERKWPDTIRNCLFDRQNKP